MCLMVINMDTLQADEYAKGLIALGLKRGDTMTTFGVVSAETLYISVAGISLGIGYSVCTKFSHLYYNMLVPVKS